MSRRIALVLLALALVASVATAASSPATSKGKKGKGGKGGSSSSCPSASCGLATAASVAATDARVAALELYETEVMDFFNSKITLGSGEGCSTTDNDDDDDDEDDWSANCSEQGAVSPRTVRVSESCPGIGGAAGKVTQFWCEAFITDNIDTILGGLPVYSSGFLGSEAACTVDISGLPDGTTVGVNTGITCSNYAVIPTGAKAADKPKLSELIRKN